MIGRAPFDVASAFAETTRMTVPAHLVSAACALYRQGIRHVIGIVGSPGSGKSTFVNVLAHALAPDAIVVPMDGFHLAQRQLERIGRAHRKGAPDTFHAAGLVAILQRLRGAAGRNTVYAPDFDRTIEEPIAGAIAIEADARLVILEGNYLLLDGAWSAVSALLDECCCLDTPEAVRSGWLLERRMHFGRDRDAAARWIEHRDLPNARVIEQSRERADRVIPWPSPMDHGE